MPEELLVIIDGKAIPLEALRICPVTGEPLVVSAERAAQLGLDAKLYGAKRIVRNRISQHQSRTLTAHIQADVNDAEIY